MTTAADSRVLDHLHLAAHAVRSRAGRGLQRADADDLRADAALALTEAARRFDPGRGAPFACYARHRLNGAVLDGMTRMWGRRRDAASGPFAPPPGERHPPGGPVPPDASAPDRLTEARRVWSWASGLPPRESALIERHYRDGVPLRRLAATMGISAGRICQLHRQALRRLRKRARIPDP